MPANFVTRLASLLLCLLGTADLAQNPALAQSLSGHVATTAIRAGKLPQSLALLPLASCHPDRVPSAIKYEPKPWCHTRVRLANGLTVCADSLGVKP